MRIKTNLLLVLALLSVSTSSIFARFVPELSAVMLAFWRMAIASFVMWVYALLVKQRPIRKEESKYYYLSGLFLALHFSCFYTAVKLTSIANATLLGITAPMFTMLYERIVLKRPLKSVVFLGFVLAGTGSLIIAGSDLFYQDSSFIGKLFGLMAALFISLVYILASRLRKDSNTVVYTKYLYTYATIFLLAISLLNGDNVIDFTAHQFGWLLSLGLIPTILGHSIFYYIIKYTTPTVVASVPIGEPIIASLFAWILFSEIISLPTVVGGVFILFGVYCLVAFSPAQKTL